jgi:hypothetical protein
MIGKLKVGVLTLYYRNYNFGGLLQAYALQSVLEQMGTDCEQICYDIRHVKIKNESKFIKLKKYLSGDFKIVDIFGIIIGKIEKKILLKVKTPQLNEKLLERLNNFKNFEMNIPHSARIYQYENISESVKDYDAFVCGGDQIWNYWIEGYKDVTSKVYSLEFVPDNIKKISYAASTRGTNLSSEYIEKLKPGLCRLDYLSIREKSAVPLVGDISGKKVVAVLDPVLLLSAEQWGKLYCNIEIPVKPYVVCYFLGKSKTKRHYAAEFAHMNNCMVLTFPYILGNEYYSEDSKFGDIQDFTSGPAEFVKLVKNAEFVITDSYHAVLFSVIFHKTFYVFEREAADKNTSTDLRMLDFLEEFGLQSRLVSPESLLNKKEIEPIDYAYADLELERRKRESLDYLKTALEIDK